ncbi:MAG: hypothetical protein J6C85_04515 [Alphaproteobacteria bacterium]|nr:hypothetical protein [Alphaproteobacteria bacterium]
MAKRRKMAQVMSDEAKIAAARKKIATLGLDEKEIMPKLLEKYGVLAYDFVSKAMMEPGRLCNRTGEKFLATKKLISHYAEDEVDLHVLAKAVNKKPDEVRAKAEAYKAEQAHDEETKPENIKRIEHTAEVKSIRLESLIAVQAQSKNSSEFMQRLQESLRQAGTQPKEEAVVATSTALLPEYDPNTLEGKAKQKAKERLAQLKEGKNGEISFADLKQNGVMQTDLNMVVSQERLGEISSSPEMLKMGEVAINVERSMPGKGRCAAGTNQITNRRDTLNFDYKDHLDKVQMTYYRKSSRAKAVATKKTATAQIEAMHQSDKFVCFDYPSDMAGNQKLGSIKAVGTIIGYSGEKNSIQPAGHTTVLAKDGVWRTDAANSKGWLFGKAAATRYGAKGEGKVSVIFDKNATVSDQMAEDILYQQYLREERQQQFMIARNNQASRNS